MTGTFVAKSIVDNKLMMFPISRLMWDLLLGKKLNLFDLRHYQKFIFKTMCEIQQKTYRKREIESSSNSKEVKQRHID